MEEQPEARPRSRASQRSVASRVSRASRTSQPSQSRASRLSYTPRLDAHDSPQPPSRPSRRLTSLSRLSCRIRPKPSEPPAANESRRYYEPSLRSTYAFLSYYQEYLKAVIGIAVLGGQITFTVIVSDISEPKTTVFARETVRLLIAISWLCFTVALGLGVFALLDSSYRGNNIGPLPLSNRFRYVWAHGVIAALNRLPMAAFFLLALAVAAYVPVVGWIAVASISFYIIAPHLYWEIYPRLRSDESLDYEESSASPIDGTLQPDFRADSQRESRPNLQQNVQADIQAGVHAHIQAKVEVAQSC
ncbi:hypothetical protein VTK26DRAFT_9147 [Humicola hyalothermophila]